MSMRPCRIAVENNARERRNTLRIVLLVGHCHCACYDVVKTML